MYRYQAFNLKTNNAKLHKHVRFEPLSALVGWLVGWLVKSLLSYAGGDSIKLERFPGRLSHNHADVMYGHNHSRELRFHRLQLMPEQPDKTGISTHLIMSGSTTPSHTIHPSRDAVRADPGRQTAQPKRVPVTHCLLVEDTKNIYQEQHPKACCRQSCTTHTHTPFAGMRGIMS
jgi:hypothetical protein